MLCCVPFQILVSTCSNLSPWPLLDSGTQTYLNWTFVTSLSLASLLTISGYLGPFDDMFNPKEARTKVVVLAERVSWGKSQVNSFGVKLFQTYIVLPFCFFSRISGGLNLYIGLLLFFLVCFDGRYWKTYTLPRLSLLGCKLAPKTIHSCFPDQLWIRGVATKSRRTEFWSGDGSGFCWSTLNSDQLWSM